MATYDEKYGLMFEGQSNQNWGLTLHIPEKVPLTTNSIFDTYEHMMAYVNNPTSSAIQGLTLAVVGDVEAKNGIYYIKTIGTKGEDGAALNNGEVIKLSTNSDSQATADEVQANLDSEISARTQADEALSGAIDTNIANIAELSGKVDTNIANIEAVSCKADANAEAIEGINADIVVVSGAVDANADAISALTDNFNTAVQEFQAADIVLSGAIDTNADAIDTINDTLDTLKVKDVKANDKVIGIDAKGVLSSELSLEYISSEQKIVLKGITGEVISTIDATDFIKDGMLENVELVKAGEGKNTRLVFTFNTSHPSGSTPIEIDVEDFLNADEVKNVEDALTAHKENTTIHFTAEERAKYDSLIATYYKEALDAKFSANTAEHGDLAAEIASANTNIAANKADIEAVSGVVDTNIANIEAVSGKADANAEAIEGINTDIEAISGVVDTNIANIEAVSGKADANAEAIEGINADIEVLSGAIDTNIANIEAVSGKADANAEAIEGINADIEAMSGVIDTNIAKIDEISGKVDTNIANIEAVSGEVKTLTDKVAENEKVAAEALNDLRANKVYAIQAAEKSNIIVTESKDENGISYTIDFQWLEF